MRYRRGILHLDIDVRAVAVRELNGQRIVAAGQGLQPLGAQQNAAVGCHIVRGSVQPVAVALDAGNGAPSGDGDIHAVAQLVLDLRAVKRNGIRRNGRFARGPDQLAADRRKYAARQRVTADIDAAGKAHAVGQDVRLIHRAVAGDRSAVPRGQIIDIGIIRGADRRFAQQAEFLDLRVERQRDAAVRLDRNGGKAFAVAGQAALIERRRAVYRSHPNTGSARCSDLHQAPHGRRYDNIVTIDVCQRDRSAGYDDRAVDTHVVQRHRV